MTAKQTSECTPTSTYNVKVVPNHSNRNTNTVEFPYNLTSWDRRKSVVIGELSL